MTQVVARRSTTCGRCHLPAAAVTLKTNVVQTRAVELVFCAGCDARHCDHCKTPAHSRFAKTCLACARPL